MVTTRRSNTIWVFALLGLLAVVLLALLFFADQDAATLTAKVEPTVLSVVETQWRAGRNTK